MEFLDMVICLKTIHDGKIILISCGAFYIAIGGDAEILNKELGLKLNCMGKHVCKVGVPKGKIEKYVKEIEKINYSYIVLDYIAEKEKIIKICEKEVKNMVNNYIYKTTCMGCRKYRNEESIYNRVFEKYINETGAEVIW